MIAQPLLYAHKVHPLVVGSRCMQNGDQLIDFLDEAKMRIQNLRASPFVGPHKERVVGWDSTLSLSRRILQAWNDVQEKWVSLEPLFRGDNALKTQPVEVNRSSSSKIMFKII